MIKEFITNYHILSLNKPTIIGFQLISSKGDYEHFNFSRIFLILTFVTNSLTCGLTEFPKCISFNSPSNSRRYSKAYLCHTDYWWILRKWRDIKFQCSCSWSVYTNKHISCYSLHICKYSFELKYMINIEFLGLKLILY